MFLGALLRFALIIHRSFVSDDVHHYRVLHEVGIFLDNLPESEFHDVIPATLVQVQCDLGAALVTVSLGDFIGSAAARFPRPRLVAAGVAGFECHLVRNHEGRVEPDTELANQFWVVLDLAFLEFLHELPCTRTGNGADIGLKFIACHADAVVLDAEGFGLVVHVELYAKLRIILYQFLVGQGLEAQPVDRIRSVADKLPQEDILVRVE